jgi:hypothetical protein
MSAPAQPSGEVPSGTAHTQRLPPRQPYGSATDPPASALPQHVRMSSATAGRNERSRSGDRSGRGSPAQSSGEELNEKPKADMPRHSRNGGREQWQWASLMKQAGYQGQPSVVRVAADGPMTDVSKQSLGVSIQCSVQAGDSWLTEIAADSLFTSDSCRSLSPG